MRKYIPSAVSNKLVAIVTRSSRAPVPTVASVINSPNQVMPVVQPPMQYQTVGLDHAYTAQVNHLQREKDVVQIIKVQQHAHVIPAPLRAFREGWRSPIVAEQVRMPRPNLSAPTRNQSIPGYAVTTRQVTISGQNATLATMYNNLRAPALNAGGGGCG